MRLQNRTQKCLAFFCAAVLFIPPTESAEYYVAKNGKDSWSGTLSAPNGENTNGPFLTIGKSIAVMNAGDTVLIRAGTYNELIRPIRSGTSDKQIVVRNYENEPVIVTNTPGISNIPSPEDPDIEGDQFGFYIYELSYLSIEGLQFNALPKWGRIIRGRHLTFKNNRFTQAKGTGTSGGLVMIYSSNNSLTGNLFRDGNDNLVLVCSDSNLVEKNEFIKGRHCLWCIRAGNYNIIRGNYFHNDIQKIGEIYDNGSFSAQSYGEYRENATKHNIVEGNEFAYTPPAGPEGPYNGIQFAGQECIIRKNIFHNCVGGGMELTNYDDEAMHTADNRVYHNVFYGNHFAGIAFGQGYTFFGNILKNNIFYWNKFVNHDGRYDDWAELSEKPVQIWNNRDTGFLIAGNNIHNLKGEENYAISHGDGPESHSFVWWQTNYPNQAKDNGNQEPGFVALDTAGNPSFEHGTQHDFHLQSGSLMIDSGEFLTTIASPSGRDSMIQVDDARYFFNGFSREGQFGDSIKLQNGQTGRIKTVNYIQNQLILDQSVSWTKGEGVSLVFAGAAPDLGAYEYNGNSGVTSSIIPSPFSLFQNYPNPSKSATLIAFYVGTYSHACIKVFDVCGREVATLVNEVKSPGSHTALWNGRNSFGQNVGTGVYFYQLSVLPAAPHGLVPSRGQNGKNVKSFILRKKMLLVK